jgi:hypothetical protein
MVLLKENKAAIPKTEDLQAYWNGLDLLSICQDENRSRKSNPAREQHQQRLGRRYPARSWEMTH